MTELLATAAAEEAQGRRRQMLRTAFGPTIAAALADPTVIEVMVNPDGRLWIERAAIGRVDSGERIGSSEAERIIRLVAAHVRREVTDKAPIVSAELPETGERFEGVMPPVAPAPCFAVRKPADVLYRLSNYLTAGIISVRQAATLMLAVRERKNILVVGGTSSGKTTLVNALLAEIADLNERVVILEDTRELKCAAVDCVALRTKPGVASLADLVRSTLRLRPDRIIVGEVRGPEALDMLKAWNTGHPGGITTVHANSAEAGLYSIAPALIESCPTRIFLPNDRALEPQARSVYGRFGLNGRQIEILGLAAPKRDYYAQTARGNRLFELGLGPVALALCGASSPDDQRLIDRCIAGGAANGFAARFLEAKGLRWAAELIGCWHQPTLPPPIPPSVIEIDPAEGVPAASAAMPQPGTTPSPKAAASSVEPRTDGAPLPGLPGGPPLSERLSPYRAPGKSKRSAP